MLPLADENGKQVVVRLPEIRAEGNRRRVEAERKAIRDAAFRTTLATRGYVQAVDTDGKIYWVDPKSREIVDYTFENDATDPVWKKTGRRYKKGVITPVEGGVVPSPKVKHAAGEVNHGVGVAVGADKERMRRGAQFLWDLIPEVKVGDTTVKDGYRFVD